jgi:photosystem II stability/assembly factor-like uncharacterized protein
MKIFHRPWGVVLSLLLLLASCAAAVANNPGMHLIAPEKGWARGSDGRLYWTNDNGAHWTDISPDVTGHMTDIFFLDGSHGWVVFTDASAEASLFSFEVARTSDSGKTWVISEMNVPSQREDELDGECWLDFVNAQHGWVVLRARSSAAFSWGFLLNTDDSGKSWTELPQVPTAGRPVFATLQDGWISGNGGPKGLYSTHDGGKTWQEVGPPLDKLPSTLASNPSYRDVNFKDAEHGFVLTYLSPANDAEESKGTALVLYTTEDGGRTWNADRILTDRGASSKTGAALSRLVASSVIPESGGAGWTLVVAFNDRKHPSQITLMTVREEEASTNTATRVSRDDVLRREGDDVAELSFATSTQGWARTSLGDILLTVDGGASWKDISPVAVRHAPRAETKELPKIRARLLGPGPKLVPESQVTGLHYTQRIGFDEHNVPTIAAMGTWFDMSPFFDVGIYVGGVNYCYESKGSCLRSDPNLTATWVTQAGGEGWGLLPLWVGPQAPCVDSSHFAEFTSANAASEGMSNADGAAAAMTALGLSDTVVFYDMENYTSTAGDSCSLAVRAFLSAWVQEMNTDGFQTTAVYGNPGPAENDFSQIPGLTQVWITSPPIPGDPPRVTIWGLGSGSNALGDTYFSQAQRAHQFVTGIGSATTGYVTYGGVATGMPIDYDVEYLLAAGGSGTKQYIWTATTVPVVPTLASWAVAVGNAINDVTLSGGSPSFVDNGQVGQAVGSWYSMTGCDGDEYECNYGFLDDSGTLSSWVDPSGAGYTEVFGINNASRVAGLYCYGTEGTNPPCEDRNEETGSTTSTQSGYLGSLTTGSFSTVNLQAWTWVWGINDDGQAIASASPTYTFDGETNFFLQSSQWGSLPIDCEGDEQPVPSGINGFTSIVGTYYDLNDNGYGFTASYDVANGIFDCIPLTLPGGYGQGFGLNNQGQVVGWYYDDDGDSVPFLLDNGNYYILPNIYNPAAINDAGQIVGSYSGGGGGSCDFVSCAVILNPE